MALVLPLLLTAVLAPANSAQAQDDHLRCYKIKDSHKFTAIADLETLESQNIFPDEQGCKVIVRSKEFCVPVTKTRTLQPGDSRDAPDQVVTGQTLSNDFLCYKVRCPKQDFMPDSQEVEDQFGTRSISSFRTSKVCTPTNKIGNTQYKDPGLLSLLATLAVGGVHPNITVTAEVVTEPEPEYIMTSVALVSSPAGFNVLSITENLGKRVCPGGVPSLAPQAFGCTQYWDMEIELLDAGICLLNDDYELSFTYGCNPAMPNCDFVNPAEPDGEVTVHLASANFCPGP